MRVLIRRAEVDGEVVDVRIDGERITHVRPSLRPHADDVVVDARGGALLPGLHDHHLHVLALAAAERSVSVGQPDVVDHASFVETLRRAHRDLPLDRWIRAVGYHERVAGDLDRHALDAIVRDRPTRVLHRGGALWTLNGAGLAAIGLGPTRSTDVPEGVELDADGCPTGRLWRLDTWLGERVPREPLDLRSTSRRLLRCGVTGLTDATPTDDPAPVQVLASAVESRDIAQRLMVTGGLALPRDTNAHVDLGPVKLLFPDHRPVSLDEMVAGIRVAREQGRTIAVHAVTSATVALVVAALDEVGARPGDRIEHGAVIPIGLVRRLADHGLTVVTNPGFVASRGDDYLADVEADEQPDLWRCRSLLDAGVAVAAGTDAPYGDPNPWTAIDAATRRETASGATLTPDESVAPSTALDMFLSSPDDPGGARRVVRAGASSDLCLLPVPLREALDDPAAVQPSAVVVRGELIVW